MFLKYINSVNLKINFTMELENNTRSQDVYIQ